MFYREFTSRHSSCFCLNVRLVSNALYIYIFLILVVIESTRIDMWDESLHFEPGHGKTCFLTYTNNKRADQTTYRCSLISALAVDYLDSMISAGFLYKMIMLLKNFCDWAGQFRHTWWNMLKKKKVFSWQGWFHTGIK